MTPSRRFARTAAGRGPWRTACGFAPLARLALALVGGWGPLRAAPECMLPTGAYVPTQVPYTYVLDRRDPTTAGFLERYRTGMPWLIETGALTPGHPYFGPVCDLGALRRGGPEPTLAEFVQRYREQRAKAPAAVARAHAAGAGQVITYICMMTTGGDPEKRTGFWRFYDHWEAFAEFGIPPKPDADPVDWQQRRADGTPVIAYTRDHPPYKPMFRWTNCINHPGWRAYQRWVTEEAARLGVDGFFVDNANTLHCYCPYCQKGFAQRLQARYTPADLSELFADDLSMTPAGSLNSPLRQAEVQLFWQESIHDFLADVKAWGSAIHGQFFVFPNGLQGMSAQIATRYRDCDLAMHEHSGGENGGNPGVVRRHVIAGLYSRAVNDHLLAFKTAAGTGALCRANVYAYCGYPKPAPAELGPNPAVAALGIAEAAAFGGGGCYAPTDWYPWLAEVLDRYNRFFAAQGELYRGTIPFGQVGILGFLLPGFFGDRSTAAGTDQALHELLGRHVLADLIPERVFSPAWIARYPVLLVPGCPILSDSQVQTLTAYAQNGGKLILLGPSVGARDACGRPRPPAALAGLRQAATLQVETGLNDAWQPGAPLAGLSLCPEGTGPLVRFAAYIDRLDEPRQLILHAVNYDVDIGVNARRVGAVEDLALAVPLPPMTHAVAALWQIPGSAEVPMAIENAGGKARLRLPRLDVYGVARLSLQEGLAP